MNVYFYPMRFIAFILPGVFHLTSLSGQTITVYPETSYQTFKHWEGVDFVGQILETNTLGTPKVNPAWPYYKDELIDKLVNDMGINRVRMEFKGGLENDEEDYYLDYLNGDITFMQLNSYRANPVNDNADPNAINWDGFQFAEIDHTMNELIIPFRNKLLADLGDTLWINLCHVGNDEKGVLHVNSPDEYAEIMLAIFVHMNDSFGIVPNSIEMTLEPDYGGSPWTAEKMVNNLLATQAKLATHNFHPRFIVPSVTNSPNLMNWWPWMKQVNTTWLQYVDEVSTHRYGSPSNTQLDQNQAIVEADGKRLSQLEFIGANYHMLHDDLKRNHIAWTQYVLASYYGADPQGAYYGIIQTDPQHPQVNVSSLAKYFRHYMRFIRPGAVRKQATTDNAQFDPVVFENVDGNYTVVIKATAGGSFSIAGLPEGTYHLLYTTQSETMVDPGDQLISTGEVITTSIPSAGVVTIFADPPPANSTDTCIAFAGRDTALCVGIYGIDTFHLGETPVVAQGIPPYTYTWSTNYQGYVNVFTASYFLDDTTKANPLLVQHADNPVIFRLDVTDSLGNTCNDSVTIQFSQYGWTLDVKERYIMQGDSVQLYLSIFDGIPPYSYLWSPAAGLTDPTDPFTWASPDTTTYYHMVVTDSAGCTGDDYFTVIVGPTGLDDESASGIKIMMHPNPASNEIMLEFKSPQIASVWYEIIDPNGTLIFSRSVETNATESIRLDDLAAGLYILKVYLKGYVSVARFLMME